MYKKFNLTNNHLQFLIEYSKKTKFKIPSPIRIRCIGWNQDISKKIAVFIINHEKIGTYSLPWLHEEYPWSSVFLRKKTNVHLRELPNPLPFFCNQ